MPLEDKNNKSTEFLRRNQLEAKKAAEVELNRINKHYSDVQRRMNEELRFLTVNDQRRRERFDLINTYYPEYGKKANFTTGLISGGSMLAGAVAGSRIPGGFGMKASGALAGGALSYLTASSLVEQRQGTETSPSGLEHLRNLQKWGPMATYAARSDWQSGFNIPGPEAFELELARPAGEIGRAWNLDPKQFLPGAMDLVSSGLIQSPSASKSRSFQNVLKEAAGIFKSMQSFFGSVDIAGLSQKIAQMQSAGFTPEGMTDLGRQVQGSIMAFAPENIRNQMYGTIMQAGNAARAQGLSATVGGHAAISGYSSAYTSFGGLSGYEKSMFRTQGGLAQAMTNNLSSVTANPLLLAGRGDVMRGLSNITGNIDLTTAKGLRDYRETIYGLSASINSGDQIDTLNNAVEQYMNTFGLDRESAAEALLGSPEQARAYIIQRESFARIQDKNLDLFAGMNVGSGSYADSSRLSSVMSRMTSKNSTDRLSGMREFTKLGVQRRMLSHMARGEAWESNRASVADMSDADDLGYWVGSKRAFNRSRRVLFPGIADASRQMIGTNIYGDNDFQRLGIINPDAATQMANDVTTVMEGYATTEGNMDPAVEEAIMELNSHGGASMILNRFKEEQASSMGQPLVGGTRMAELAKRFGLNKVAAVMGDGRLRGQFLKRAEDENAAFASGVTRNLYGLRSLNGTKNILGSLSGDVFQKRKTNSVLRDIGSTLSNSMTSVGIIGISTAVGAVGAGLASGGTGVLAGAWGGAKVGGWVAAGASLLGSAFEGIADAQEGNLSRKAAKELNRSMYGTTVVVNMIMGSFPESTTSLWDRATEKHANDFSEACAAAARTIYGTARNILAAKPDMGRDAFVAQAKSEILQKLGEMVDVNSYMGEIHSHYVQNNGILNRLMAIIYSYVTSHSSPASVSTIESAVKARADNVKEDMFKGWLGGGDQKIAAMRRVLNKGSGIAVSDLMQRAKFKAGDVKEMRSVAQATLNRVKGVVTTAEGRDITAESATQLIGTISEAAQKIQKENIEGEEARNRILRESLSSAGFKSDSGYKEIIDIMRGVSESRKTSKEMSPVVVQVVKDVLDDPTIKDLIKENFAAQKTLEPSF